MRINHNIASLNTYRQLSANNVNSGKSLEKLSSGLRINRAGDDAAGLAISEKMRAQIKGLNMASKNSQDGISLIQTAEGALGETQSILQRMRELAVQSSNDTNVSVDRDQIQKEINQLTSEVNRIGTTTEFNTMKLLNGDKATITNTTNNAVLGSGSKTVNLITAYSITDANNLRTSINGNSISVANGSDWATQGAGNTGTASIVISKSSGGAISVSLDITGAGSLTATDTINANGSGDYVYNNHGISFTIKAADYASMATGTLTVSGLSTSQSTISLNNDWDSNTGVATLTSGITVTASADNKDVWSVKVTSQSANGQITVQLLGSGGNTIQNDVFSGITTLNYNDHGINFRLDTTGASAGASASGQFSLTALRTTSSVSTVSYSAGLTFQVGANQNQEMVLNIEDMRSTALAISTTAAGTTGFRATAEVTNGETANLVQYALDVSSSSSAAASAVTIYNNAINSVSQERSKLGAVQNRLEHTISNLDASAENLQASESRIRDVDMAKEMMEFSKNNILTQAAQSMLAQANQQPQGVLQLLR